MIGAAVLAPALAIAYLIVQSRLYLIHTEHRPLMQAIAVDAAVLLLGLMLNRGDDL